DLADEIAYLAHDADDGVKAGMLTVEQLEQLTLYREARAALAQPQQDARIARHQTVNRMIDLMVTDLVTNIDRELSTGNIESIEKVREAGRAVANFSGGMTQRVTEIKRFMRDELYRHPRVAEMT